MMMIMMKKEHTWSWASEPADCTVHLRAVNQLPWGGTALLTPPSAVICGSSHQNWLSGPTIDITNPMLIAYYVPFWTHDMSQTWHTDFISSNIHSLLAPVCACARVCVSDLGINFCELLRIVWMLGGCFNHFKCWAEDETLILSTGAYSFDK